MKLKTKIKNHSLILGVTLLFLTHQIYFILKGGTTWDDLEILLTSERVLDKAYWNFVDRSNPFLGDYNFNLEYYGYSKYSRYHFLKLMHLKNYMG